MAACAYPLTLLALCVAFSAIGERHWVTAGLLYVPRALFAAPLLLLAPALWLSRSRDLLWTQAAALLVVVLPLMGLVLPWRARAATGPTLRVLSYNVDTARAGADRLLGVVDQLSPDLVLFQESPYGGPLHAGLRERFAHVEGNTQFIIASRFPILELSPPLPTPDGHQYLQRYMRYLVDSSLGKLAVYNVHPLSPRGTVGVPSLRSFLRDGPSARAFESNPEARLASNAALREQQFAEAATLAQKETYPVLLAGDTNLPGLSRTLREHLSGYIDGFERASAGFGYTFPAKRPFLRLDRIVAQPALDFSAFRVGCPDASDHCWVMAELFRR